MELRRPLVLCSLSAFLFVLTGVGVTEGIRCYQCGTFLATTSVSPCLNFTGIPLKDCPHAFCSKYVGLSATVIVYGCEPNCVEKQHGSFESYCCSDDGCNHSPRATPSPYRFLILTSSLLTIISFLLPAIRLSMASILF